MLAGLSNWLSLRSPTGSLRWAPVLATLVGIMICLKILIPTQPELIPKPFIIPQEIVVSQPQVTAQRFVELMQMRNIPVVLEHEPSILA